MSCRLITVGSSWGGVEAVTAVISSLSPRTAAAVAIAQHRGPQRSALASLLTRQTPWTVEEAEDKAPIEPGRAYLAPPGYHLLVETDRVALSTEGPVSYSRPSVDVLFESAAAAYGPRAVGVVLTGSNRDGADGLAAIARRGGVAVVQDPATAARRAMPAAALAAVPHALVLPLEAIGAKLTELCPPSAAVA